MSESTACFINANVLTPNGLIEDAFVECRGETIFRVGSMDDASFSNSASEVLIDCQHHLLTPGFIDCHTHLIYAGNRANEFERRLLGESYAAIAKSGGGILSTVQATRRASFDALYDGARERLVQMMREGVIAVEIKSGYGLDLETELKMLKVARQLHHDLDIHIEATFLGAHACPPEYKGKTDAYIDFLCREVLPRVKDENLASAVDVFCESIGFNLAQTEKVFECALSLGLNIKCHAEQLTNMGGTSLAAKKQALSSDHLEYVDEDAVALMAKHGTVAVILPGAFYYLNETKKPPVQLFRDHGVGMALATDCNPGSSPTTSLQLMMNMACVLFGMTVSEVFSGVTEYAAKALNLRNIGSITDGMQANLLLWPISTPRDLCYSFGTLVRPRRFFGTREINLD